MSTWYFSAYLLLYKLFIRCTALVQLVCSVSDLYMDYKFSCSYRANFAFNRCQLGQSLRLFKSKFFWTNIFILNPRTRTQQSLLKTKEFFHQSYFVHCSERFEQHILNLSVRAFQLNYIAVHAYLDIVVYST